MAAALVEQTYDALMQMIMDGNYKPGDRLPSEMILCNNLQVSRNTLRAALNKLNVLGFTETRQGGGTYMRAVDSSVYLNFFVPATLTSSMDLLEIMQFRKGIEVEAARLAAENATEEAHLCQPQHRLPLRDRQSIPQYAVHQNDGDRLPNDPAGHAGFPGSARYRYRQYLLSWHGTPVCDQPQTRRSGFLYAAPHGFDHRTCRKVRTEEKAGEKRRNLTKEKGRKAL